MGLSDRLSDRLGPHWSFGSPEGGSDAAAGTQADADKDTAGDAARDAAREAVRAGSHERYHASARVVGDPIAEVRKRVHRSLLEIMGPKLYEEVGGDVDLGKRVREMVRDLLARDETPLAGGDRARIAREVTDEILGHGPIEPLLRDPAVSEIMVNGPSRIFVERSGRLSIVDAEFADEAHLRRVIDRIVSRVGRRVDEASSTRSPSPSRRGRASTPRWPRSPATVAARWWVRRHGYSRRCASASRAPRRCARWRRARRLRS